MPPFPKIDASCQPPIPRSAVDRTIGAAFAESAAHAGDSPAVKMGEKALSYGELDCLSNRLAHALSQFSEGIQQRVALLIEDRIQQVLAMLGVLKAGHLFVPLATTDPPARLASLITDAQPACVITDAGGAEIARQAAQSLPRLELGALDSTPVEFLSPVELTPSACACLIYTSGSTGRPKGVLQTHRNILHHVAKYTRTIGLTRADRLTWLTSYVFAASISDVFPTLLNGATLLPYAIERRGFAELGSWLRAERVTIYYSVPSVLRRLAAQERDDTRFSEVRLVRLGGESLRATDVEIFRRLFGRRCRMLNSLGATEINLIRHFFVDADTPLTDATVPAGYEVEDTEVRLIDEQGRDVSPGCIGQIAVRSRYLSPGYWRQPELTQATFLADAGDPELRTYLTGDLGRMLPDGCLVHLGRIDRRVKVHGRSVDLQEVETAIARLDLLEDVAVVDVSGAGDDDGVMLVAYLVGRGATRRDSAALRAQLARTLPAHMMPLRFIYVDTLPLTSTGKIDRQELRRRAIEQPVSRAGAQAPPRDATESALVQLWEGLLKVRQIGITDNFFDLGGDSLLALRMLDEAQRLFGRAVSPNEFQKAPTIRGLTDIGRRAQPACAAAVIVAVKAAGTRAPLLLVPGAGSDVLALSNLCRHIDEAQPLYGLRMPGLVEGEKPLDRVEAIAAYIVTALHREGAIRRFKVGGVSFGGLVALEIAQQLQISGEPVDHVYLLDTAAPRYPRRRWIAGFRHPIRLVQSLILPPGARDLFTRERLELGWRDRRSRLQARLAAIRQSCGGRRMSALDRRMLLQASCFRAADCYRPSRYDGAVTLLRADRQPPPDQYDSDERLGWGDRLPRLRVVATPGGHNDQWQGIAVPAVAAVLSE
ncbi:MAG: AMP-binding protein [Acidobacteriota bacterium]